VDQDGVETQWGSPTGWLGVDTGGTFTDFVWYVSSTGELALVKVPSRPADPATVFREGMERLGHRLGNAERVVYGTTLVTNAVIERDGARVATVTSRGYRDVVEIGRQNRFEMYNLKTLRAAPLSPRRWRYELNERVLWDGTVAAKPSTEEVEALARELERAGVEAVAICFLFSFLNPEHERSVAAKLRGRGSWYVTSSHEVGRQSREYERFSTTVLNAFVGPKTRMHLDGLAGHFRDEGLDIARVFLMGASGGTMTWHRAGNLPVALINSGPAGGVRAAVELARVLGLGDIVTYDMGGTSTDVCLVKGLEPAITSEGYVERRPLVVPHLDVVTIGAGGGSLAWIDRGGELNVGPRSAGATPGPACYQRGGIEPTVTDANAVIGRLPAGHPLGGVVPISVPAAATAVRRIAQAFAGMSVEDAAEGIVRIAVAKMVTAIREVSVARGLDPREFVLVAYGGAGPMHATQVAAELNIPRVVIPPAPGNFSALGLLMSDVRHDLVQSRFVRLAELDLADYRATFAALEAAGRDRLRQEGFREGAIRVTRSVDMRYVGQWFELNVPAPADPVSMDEIDRLFRTAHRERYRVDMERPTEFVHFRLAAHGLVAKPRWPQAPTGACSAATRGRVRFGGKWLEVPVYERAALPVGTEFGGPAIVVEFGATTVVSPGYAGAVHPTGALLLTQRRAA
jgi:N-methylhydantoinase A